MSENKGFKPMLAKVNETYYPVIENQLVNHGVEIDDYQKRCVINAISAINNTLDTAGIAWNDPQLDQSNLIQVLLRVASLKLNASANPREVYFQIRNVKRKEKGKDVWKKQIEMGIEGDGNDAILSNFGRHIKEVRQYWLVREEDEFHYPEYNGLEMTPPRWKPSGKGKVVRVVYPIIKTSGAVEFYIAEREDVLKNLIAHINNNLMNETFGIAKDRWSATKTQKDQINKKKQGIIDKVKKLGLDKALEDKELQKYISPAWKDDHSRESMIIRKMRNNITKKIPKDFGHTFIEMTYEDTTNEYRQNVIEGEIVEHANSEAIDIEPDETIDVEQEQEPEEAPKEEQKTEKEPKGEEQFDEVPF